MCLFLTASDLCFPYWNLWTVWHYIDFWNFKLNISKSPTLFSHSSIINLNNNYNEGKADKLKSPTKKEAWVKRENPPKWAVCTGCDILYVTTEKLQQNVFYKVFFFLLENDVIFVLSKERV